MRSSNDENLEPSPQDLSRWRRIEELYAAAADHPSDQRSAFLDQECMGDAELRREVESLLLASDQADGFLTPDHLGKHISEMSASAQSLVGRTLGRYEILSRLSAGAMGDVYLARDRELGRRAAIKVLTNSLEGARDASSRFVQEARAASALNHPNIITVYEAGQSDGRHFIATEFIEGATLRDRMAAGRVPLTEGLDIAIQCGAALEAAHQAGIVHRDIKPENIMLRPDGLVKVVDFGLARVTELYEGPALVRTVTGAVMGTPRYMSPEQARGLPLDERTDVFSLATVVYEMFSGEPRFRGATPAELFDSLLSSGPQQRSAVLDFLPSDVKAVLVKALEKDRDLRYQSMRQFRQDLSNARQQLASSGPVRSSKRSGLLLLVAAAAVAAIAVAAVWFFRTPTAGPLQILRPLPFTTDPGFEYEPRISPDGKWVAFSRARRGNRPDVVIQEGGPLSPARVVMKDVFSPAWSPRGDSLAVLRNRTPDSGPRDVLLIGLADNRVRKIGEIDTPGAFQDWVPSPYIDFSPDGRYLVASDGWSTSTQSSLVLMSVETGDKLRLTTPPPGTMGDFAARFSPDGKRIVFARVHRFAASNLHVLDLTPEMKAAGLPRKIDSGDLWNAFPAWTSDSRHIIFAAGQMRNASLKLVPSSGSGGSRLPVQETAVTTLDVRQAGPSGAYRIVYTRFPRNDDILRVAITRADPEANGRAAEPLINSSFVDEQPAYSPDGSKIAFVSDRTGSLQIWMAQADGSSPQQLTRAPSADFHHLVWSPDGQRLAVQAVMPSEAGIYEVSASGGGDLKLLASGDAKSPAYSPDGQWLYFGSRRSGSARIWRVPAGGGNPEIAVELEGDALAFPPDGKVVVFARGLELFVKPRGGGPAKSLFPVIYSHQSFAVTNTAVFAAVQSGNDWMLMAHHFADQRNVPVAAYQRQLSNGISVSPDGRYALLTERQQVILDLMLLDSVDLSRY